MMRYHDLTLTITATDISLLHAVEGHSGEKSEPFIVDHVMLLALQRLNYWLNHSLHRLASTQGLEKPCQVADLQAMGWLLHEIVFRDRPKIKDLFYRAYDNFEKAAAKAGDESRDTMRLRLHLILDSASADLATLPWEFLFVPLDEGRKGFFFSGERTELILSRYSPDEQIEADMKPLPSPLKILFIVNRAGPDGMTIDPDEVNSLMAAIGDLGIEPGLVKVVPLHDPTYDQVRTNIEQLRPHIVHYMGHGEPGKLALSKDKNDPDYDVKLKAPQLRWINAQQFKELFNNPPKPRLVFLHACKGAAFEFFQSLSSTARDLVNAGIPAVVAMQYNISNADAGTFARRFYDKLGQGESIDEAVKAGRVFLGSHHPGLEHPRFGTPVLYMQCRTAIVLPPTPDALAQKALAAASAAPSLPSAARGPASAPASPQSAPSAPAPSRLSEAFPADAVESAAFTPTELPPGTAAAAAAAGVLPA